jgi:hypothetical protein
MISSARVSSQKAALSWVADFLIALACLCYPYLRGLG